MRVWVPSWLLEEKNVTSTRDGIRTDFWESVLNQAFNAEIALYFVNQDCFKMSHLTALIHISILLFLAIQWHKNYVVKNSSSCCSCILGVCHFPQLLLWPCAWMSTIPLLCSPRLRLHHKAGVPQTLQCSCGLRYLFFHFRYQPLRESSRWWSYVSNWESNRLSIPLTKDLSGTPGRWLDPQLEPAQPGSFMKQERFKNPLCRKWNF